ncbi:hypothetical protein [Dysgonomonas macrotermitis]|uniref:ABC-type phosphate transport system, substrate-binding protein n=1 Tax=Dysgonomonas macrotermitis TaxID=1346286 RepID=A0A1M5BM45_9BACT|nr:hypothetical protein [Dysgonomonas macrotermitis]SHF43571.1 ABC-type phosphate transport system, substrate-binding protein [Dysgonomonas macrotermitis]
MKTSKYTNYIVAALLILGSASLFAQNTKDVLYIKGANFTHPILNAWIAEYNKQNPNVEIKLATKETADDEVAIRVLADDVEKNQTQLSLQVARYAILPVTNNQNPILAEVDNKGLNKDKIQKLFFEKDIDNDGKYPFKSEPTVYSGSLSTSNSAVVSEYFEKEAAQLKGKKIAGDDIFLITALAKDQSGIAFNYLSYIYDTKSKKLKDGIAILPIDLKKDQWQTISSGIEGTLQLLEKEKVNLIPVKPLSVAIDYVNLNKDTQDFLEWVVTAGQQVNHAQGFLTVDSPQQDNLKKQINYASLQGNK